jgi:hypothetical protein
MIRHAINYLSKGNYYELFIIYDKNINNYIFKIN